MNILNRFNSVNRINHLSKLSGSNWNPLLTDGTTDVRFDIRDNHFCIDKTLTPLGFDGIENTDWVNVSIKKIYATKPSNVTLSLIQYNVKIDWTADSDDQIEIWGRTNDNASALLYTISAGTYTKNDAISYVDVRKYKLRAKNGAFYSEFTDEQSIALLGANLITNGGTPETTDWVDTNGDGIPDGWTESAVDISTIITGNGFTGNAVRLNGVLNRSLIRAGITLTVGKTYLFGMKYRSSIATRMYTNTSSEQIASIASSSGVLTPFAVAYKIVTGTSFRFYLGGTGYFECDELLIKEVLNP